MMSIEFPGLNGPAARLFWFGDVSWSYEGG